MTLTYSAYSLVVVGGSFDRQVSTRNGMMGRGKRRERSGGWFWAKGTDWQDGR